MASPQRNNTQPIGLGLDAGGTETRWALAAECGVIVAEGSIGGMSGLMMATVGGRAQMTATLNDLAKALHDHEHATCVYAGLTGFDEDGRAIAALMGDALGVDHEKVTISNDIEIAYLDCFAPGEGYVVYAGTGSVAAFIDTQGELHRAGGRGALLDDAGGGYWIAREALRHIWRAEDELPGTWRSSAMANAVFARIGGNDWAHTRKFVYEGSRGDIGKLALAVAAAAEQDPIALKILSEAGNELARLASAMIARFGSRPIALTGRAVQLHPAVESAFRAALLSQKQPQKQTQNQNKNVTPQMITVKLTQPHIAAARVAVARAAASRKAATVSI